MNNFALIGIIIFTFHYQIETKMKLSLINPDGKIIKLEVVNYQERVSMRENIAQFYKMDIDIVRKAPIYLLNDGRYFFEYTKDTYAFIFDTKNDIDLFLLNVDKYFTTSLIIKKDKIYYNYTLHSYMVKELMEEKPKEIFGYPPKSSMLDFKLYKLKNGHYLRAWERVENSGVYDGYWFPDLETFEWYFKNDYCP